MSRRVLRGLLTGVSLWLLLGCGARSPAVRFYTMAPMEPQTVAQEQGDVLLGVGPVRLPDVLTYPQVVLRTSPYRVERAEFHRWGGALQTEIPRLLALNLARLLQQPVVTYPWSRGVRPHLQLRVEIDRFDGRPGGQAELWVRWSLERVAGGGSELELSIFREPVSGDEVEDLVAAQSRLLEAFSRHLAERLATTSAVTLASP